MSNQDYFNNPCKALWEQLQWEPSAEQLEQMTCLQRSLVSWNQKFNLTRLTNGEDYWIAQVFDCLWPLNNELKSPLKTRKCIDIGSGCGFPGIAVAIALPGADVTLIDSVRKKTHALREIANNIGLSSRVTVRTERAESIGQNPSFRGKFDFAMARAVAKAPVLAEYLVPLINRKGEALLYLGKWDVTDEANLLRALDPLKANLSKVMHRTLPADRGERHLLRIKVSGECPKTYPRRTGIPSKFPL